MDLTEDTPAPALYTHYCCHKDCTKWGGFGMDRYERKTKITYWWCWEHYPYKEPPAVSRRKP